MPREHEVLIVWLEGKECNHDALFCYSLHLTCLIRLRKRGRPIKYVIDFQVALVDHTTPVA